MRQILEHNLEKGFSDFGKNALEGINTELDWFCQSKSFIFVSNENNGYIFVLMYLTR